MTALCHNCPDHEACMTGWPCEVVKRYAPAEPPSYERIEHWPEWTCRMCGKTGFRARPDTHIICTCGHITLSGPPVPLVWQGDYA